jgi:diaminopimelate decarboxylase
LTQVVRIQDRPDRPILVLDAAMNDLLRPAMYEAHHALVPVHAPAAAAPLHPVDLVGPVCETGDTFARNRPMPPLGAGDLCAFLTAGAYGAVMASTYNARPLVPEVLVAGDQFHLVRERFDIAAQLKLEHLPPWLEADAAAPHSGHTGR